MAKLEDIVRSAEISTTPKNKKVAIEFVYSAPEAKAVFLAGSFNKWDPRALPMKKNKHGQWKATVKLVPGRYEYKFIADGSWVLDMRCPEVVANDKGTTNCVISVNPEMAA